MSGSPLNKKMVKADPVTGDAILLINVSTTPSYIAAQEITTVEDSRRWLDEQLGNRYHW